MGDAATAFDPLSSQGIAWALESGLMAAEAIDGHRQGDRTALQGYARQVESEFSRYLAMRAEYYGRERRWPDSLFWRRRHVPVPAGNTPSLERLEKNTGLREREFGLNRIS